MISQKKIEGGVHLFEAAGLGKAPFRFIGCVDDSVGANPSYGGMVFRGERDGVDHWTQPGGSCAYCGQGIIVFCWIRSADGKKFKVGSDCVKKVGDAGLRLVVDTAVAKRRREQKQRRDAARIANARELLRFPTVCQRLRDQVHPVARHAACGLTMWHWVDWMLRHAGIRGKLSACKAVEAACAEPGELDRTAPCAIL